MRGEAMRAKHPSFGWNRGTSAFESETRAAQLKYLSGFVLLGVPVQPSAAYRHVYFYVDARTFYVRRAIINDAQRNRNRFDFENPRFNPKVSPNEFVFTPPHGTRIF